MEIGFDRAEWRHTGLLGPHLDGQASQPDWRGLRARMFTAWVAREAIAAAQDKSDSPGSFDSGSAHALAEYEHASRVVNPVALANGKSVAGMDAGDADAFNGGDRG